MMKRQLFIPFIVLLLGTFIFGSCSGPDSTTTTTTEPAAATTTAASEPATSAGPPAPQGELIASLSNFGGEHFIPWKADVFTSQMNCLVYEVLIYWDEVNRTYLPGLAEQWELSPDAMTTTFYLRQGVQFHDGWGEFTAEDLKFNFERHAAKDSIGRTTETRNIESMDIPDPYTLVVHFKKPAPIFFSSFSMGLGGTMQGLVSKKYFETVGEETAGQKPIGTGPYKLVESQLASYYKFEALESHWRVVPEFKYLTMRLVPEMSTMVAMLKNKEIDLANVAAEQLEDLKASGLATEISPVGTGVLVVGWGGMVIPEDHRYDPDYHNKDPWADPKVRKAMAISVDREAMCKTVFSGGAIPAGVPMQAANMDEYLFTYDPETARKLLAEAGYSDGFSFEVITYPVTDIPEMPRVAEVLVGYWQEIGLEPTMTVMDYATYANTYRVKAKTAGKVYLFRVTPAPDMLDKIKVFMMPGAPALIFQDEGSYAIWQEGMAKVNADERLEYADKLNRYYYENVGPLPLSTINSAWAWNPEKISEFPHPGGASPYYFEYVRHAEPLDTFRLYNIWPGR